MVAGDLVTALVPWGVRALLPAALVLSVTEDLVLSTTEGATGVRVLGLTDAPLQAAAVLARAVILLVVAGLVTDWFLPGVWYVETTVALEAVEGLVGVFGLLWVLVGIWVDVALLLRTSGIATEDGVIVPFPPLSRRVGVDGGTRLQPFKRVELVLHLAALGGVDAMTVCDIRLGVDMTFRDSCCILSFFRGLTGNPLL